MKTCALFAFCISFWKPKTRWRILEAWVQPFPTNIFESASRAAPKAASCPEFRRLLTIVLAETILLSTNLSKEPMFAFLNGFSPTFSDAVTMIFWSMYHFSNCIKYATIKLYFFAWMDWFNATIAFKAVFCSSELKPTAFLRSPL